MTLLESLKKYTTVVADTGDIEALRGTVHRTRHEPSLLYMRRRCGVPALGGRASELALERGAVTKKWRRVIDRLSFSSDWKFSKWFRPRLDGGRRQLELRYGRDGCQGRKLISYMKGRCGRERILIKIASTWKACVQPSFLKRKAPLQSDTSISSPKPCLAELEYPDFAFRRPHLRLV